MIKKSVYTIVLVGLIHSNLGFSQNLDCNNPINYARDLYSIGDFRTLKLILKNCVLNNKKSSNFERNQARELFALSAIAQDSITGAQNYITEIILSDASFEPALGNSNYVFNQIYIKSYKDNVGTQISSVSKRPEDIRTAPANVELITSEQIISRGYGDIIDLLSDIPGFEISKTYSVLYSQIYQLGFAQNNTERTLLMIDGVEENDVWLNWAYLSRQYPISNIKAVEVVYGPTGTMYGPRAFVGAINIITFPPGERAGDFFKQRENRNSDIYANINAGGGSFNTKDLDITIGNTMAKSKIKYQVTARLFKSDEHDMTQDTFYDYDVADLNEFQYGHLTSSVNEVETATGKTIEQLTNDYGSYFIQTGDELSLSTAGLTKVREADRSAYTRSVNGLPLQASNHTDNFFIGGKLAFGNFLLGYRTWKKIEGFGQYTDLDVAPSKNGSVWAPMNTTIYLKFNESLNENIDFSVLSTYKNHKLGRESNRVNFVPFAYPYYYQKGISDAPLTNFFKYLEGGEYSQTHGWKNRLYFYQATQGRTEARINYSSDKINTLVGVDYRITSTQGDYQVYDELTNQEFFTTFSSASDYTEYISETNGQLSGKPVGQVEGFNAYLIQSLGVFAQTSISFAKNFGLTAGVRYDSKSVRQIRLFDVYTPRFGMYYNTDLFTIKGNYSKGYQNVSLWTRFSTGAGRFPNNTLVPEENDYFDLTIMGGNKSKTFEWKLNGFSYKVKNAVTGGKGYVPSSGTTVVETGTSDAELKQLLDSQGISHNRSEIRNMNVNIKGYYQVMGSTFSLNYRKNGFSIFANGTFFEPNQLDVNNNKINRIADIASLKGNFGFGKRMSLGNFNLNLSSRLNWVGARMVGAGTTKSGSLGYELSGEIPSYLILNGNFIIGHKKFSHVKLNISGANLLNAIYFHPGPRSANGDYGLAAPEANWNDTVNNQILFDFVPYVRQRSRFLVFKLIFDF
jgi:outer membrane receptor for ferrienterochelin and colicins